jgi:hypothetical protein
VNYLHINFVGCKIGACFIGLKIAINIVKILYGHSKRGLNMIKNIEITVKTTVYKKEIFHITHLNFIPIARSKRYIFNTILNNYKRKGTWVYRCDK